MSIGEGFKASGMAAAGGAAASLVNDLVLSKFDSLKKYKYGVPAAMFIAGHVVARKVHQSVGHSMCAIAGYQIAQMVYKDQAAPAQNAQGFGYSPGYQFTAANGQNYYENAGAVYNPPAYVEA